MTTLTSAVSIGDNQLLIDAPLAAGQIPGWVKIDSELLEVGGQHFRTGTTLVLSEPATAAHNSGATVTYAGDPFDADFLAATGGLGPVQVVTRTLTSAEILAMFSTPIALVAGVPDKVLWAINAIAFYQFGTVAYGGPGSGQLAVGQPGAFHVTGVSDVIVGPIADQVSFFVSPGSYAAGDQVVGEPLQIFFDAADPIDGDGTLDITVIYRTVDVS